jgi:hypothetical protein
MEEKTRPKKEDGHHTLSNTNPIPMAPAAQAATRP